MRFSVSAFAARFWKGEKLVSTEANRTIAATPMNGAVNGAIPHPRSTSGTYVADTYSGDLTATSGGTPALANDGEPAGLARVTLAMRPAPVPPPAPGRLVGICAWAAAIGIVGLILAIRSGYAVLSGAPGWFFPLALITGLSGFATTVAAFFSTTHRRRPWILLGYASATLVVALILIYSL
jgi:hypothetical protein